MIGQMVFAVFLMTMIPVLFGILILSEILFAIFKKQIFKNISLGTQKTMHDMFTPKRRR